MQAMKLVGYVADGFNDAGGVFMWVTLFLGMFGFALAAERAFYLYIRCGMNRHKYMIDLHKILRTGDMERAVKFSAGFTTPLAKLMTTILANRDKGEQSLNKAVDEVFVTEVPKMNRFIPLIAVVANLATLMGLLGTIFGLIMSFDAVANVPAAQRAQALSSGIQVAMTATAFGLCVAVCAVFANGMLVSQAERLSEELDEKATKMINNLTEEAKA